MTPLFVQFSNFQFFFHMWFSMFFLCQMGVSIIGHALLHIVHSLSQGMREMQPSGPSSDSLSCMISWWKLFRIILTACFSFGFPMKSFRCISLKFADIFHKVVSGGV